MKCVFKWFILQCRWFHIFSMIRICWLMVSDTRSHFVLESSIAIDDGQLQFDSISTKNILNAIFQLAVLFIHQVYRTNSSGFFFLHRMIFGPIATQKPFKQFMHISIRVFVWSVENPVFLLFEFEVLANQKRKIVSIFRPRFKQPQNFFFIYLFYALHLLAKIIYELHLE